jgi:hypothetical protein
MKDGHMTIKTITTLTGFAVSALSLPIAQAPITDYPTTWWGHMFNALSTGSSQVVLGVVCVVFAIAIVKQNAQAREISKAYIADLKNQNDALVKLVERASEATTKMSTSADRLLNEVNVMHLTSTKCSQFHTDLGQILVGLRDRWDRVASGKEKTDEG